MHSLPPLTSLKPLAFIQVGRPDLSGAVDRSLIEEDAPELESLLSQLVSSLHEVRSRVGPLVKEVCLILLNLSIAEYDSKGRWQLMVYLLDMEKKPSADSEAASAD